MKIKVLGLLAVALVMLASFKKEKKNNLADVSFYEGSYDDLLRESKKQKKPILLEFWAAWCIPCKKMNNETLSEPDFAAYLNKNFLVYKVNIDTFDGMNIADRYSVDNYPTLVVLDSRNKYINRFRGVFPSAHLKKELDKNKALKGKDFNALTAATN